MYVNPNIKAMNKELKQSVTEAWNEAEELHQSLSTLNNDEIVQCRKALRERAEKIMKLLTDFVCEADLQL